MPAVGSARSHDVIANHEALNKMRNSTCCFALALALTLVSSALATRAAAQDGSLGAAICSPKGSALVTVPLETPRLHLSTLSIAQESVTGPAGPDIGLLLSGAGAGLVGVVGLTVALSSYLSPDQAVVRGDGSIIEYTRTDQTASALWLSLGIAGLAAGIAFIALAYGTSGQAAAARRFDGAVHF